MKIPPLLIVVSLSFWGWQIGSGYLGIVLGIILEGARYAGGRVSLRDEDYRRIWDLCSLTALIAALYCFVTLKSGNEIAGLLSHFDWRGTGVVPPVHGAIYFGQWWPLLLFPFALACTLGSRRHHHYATFVWLLRNRSEFAGRGRVDALVGYLALTFLSASAVLPRGKLFFFVVSALIWCLLWAGRGRRSPTLLWLCLAGLAVHLGYWGHLQLNRLQGRVEEAMADFSTRLMTGSGDPLRSHTSMGRVGELKLSGRVVFRMTVERGQPPSLLRQASYSNFVSPTWFVGTRKNAQLLKPRNETSWLIGEETVRETTSTIRLNGFLGNFLLPVPLGAWRLDELDADELLRNFYGTVSVKGGSRYRDFRVQVAAAAAAEAPPAINHFNKHEDLSLPYRETELIESIAAELELHNKSENEVIRILADYFGREFTYSTYQDVSAVELPGRTSALEHFLETSKTGHCEFFATATTLLLREAGIPARYVVGYSVGETEDDNPVRYVIRERHGHAWVSFWSKEAGRWYDFDTTPASSFAVDAEAASAYEPISDWLNKLRFAFSNWWRTTDFQQWQLSLLSLACAILLVVAWRVATQIRGQARRDRLPENKGPSLVGLDSDFYKVTAVLEALGYGRRSDESDAAWLARLDLQAEIEAGSLRALFRLHQRYRFDPAGISSDDRRRLEMASAEWTARHGNGPNT